MYISCMNSVYLNVQEPCRSRGSSAGSSAGSALRHGARRLGAPGCCPCCGRRDGRATGSTAATTATAATATRERRDGMAKSMGKAMKNGKIIGGLLGKSQ